MSEVKFRYYKKADPTQKLLLGDGSWISFQDVGQNVGTIIVGKPYFVEQLTAIIHRGVGAVTEITEAEYADLQKKKTTTSWIDSRELVRLPQMQDAALSLRAAAAPAGGPKTTPENGAAPAAPQGQISTRFEGGLQPIDHKPVAPGFKPASVKRALRDTA